MNVIVFACVHCGKRFKAPLEMVGKQLQCPKCGKQITVPAKSDPAVEAAVAHVSSHPVPPSPKAHIAAPTPTVAAPPAGPGAAQRTPVAPSPVAATASLGRMAAAVAKQPASPAVQPRVAERPASPVREVAAPPQPADEAGECYPWETPAEVLEKAEAYREQGTVRAYSCKVEESLEGLLRPQVFKSIKQKAKQEANLAELQIFPDLVGIVHRPEELGCLGQLIMLVFPVQWAVMVLGLFANLIGLGIIGVIGIVVYLVLARFLGYLGAVGAIVAGIALLAGGNALIRSLSQKRLAHIAAKIRANPRSCSSVKQMFKRAGWVRWRTGVGRGQTGAAMAERYWAKGDVVQLVRVDARRRLLMRNLLLIVMDSPVPASPGLSSIGIVLFCKRAFCPCRRIYVVDFEGGTRAADEAAQAAGVALGLPVQQGRFGFLALSLNS